MSTVIRIISVRESPTESGLGWTTQGWRPISVKIQPAEFARNGVGIAMRQIQLNSVPALPVGTRPLRVNHQLAASRMPEPASRPIIARNAQ